MEYGAVKVLDLIIKKYRAIPYGTKCELITKNYAFKNNYWWDLINYNGELVYVPNKWNKYLQN